MGLFRAHGRRGRGDGTARALKRSLGLDDRIYAGLAIVITLAAFADLLLTGGAGLLFLAQKLMDLVESLTFWRS